MSKEEKIDGEKRGEGGVWVGIRGFGFGEGDLVVAGNLKTLCEGIGYPYGTAKRKLDKGVGPVWLIGGDRGEIGVAWLVRWMAVKRGEGRGGLRPGKTDERQNWEGA